MRLRKKNDQARIPTKWGDQPRRGGLRGLVNSILYGVVIVKAQTAPLGSHVQPRFIGSGRFDEVGHKNRCGSKISRNDRPQRMGHNPMISSRFVLRSKLLAVLRVPINFHGYETVFPSI